MTEQVERNYDIANFDWDGEDEVVGQQAAVDNVEALIREALQVTMPVEDAWLRPSKVDADRARIAYNVPYSLSDGQKSSLEKLVGETRTLTFNAREYHDHPVSHCVTEISEDILVRKFGQEPFVAVWGNASRHRRNGHTGAKTVSSRMVPHDWFRNRGMEESVTDIDAFVEARGHLRYRLFLATHSLYYTSLDEVATWLGGNMNAEYYAIVHRHNKSKGSINDGELQYTVDSDGIVTQTNPVTGFRYKHRTIEPLFHADSCKVLGGRQGLAWDINRLAGDTYVIKFVLCEAEVARNILDPWELIRKDREVFTRGDVTVYRSMGFEWYVYHGASGRVLLEDTELYDRLRRTIAGKQRTPRAKEDLMNMCRRLANKNDIISIHQGFAHEVPPERMTDYVNAAFYADVKHELEVALLYHRENRAAVDALNKFMADGHVPADLTSVVNVGRAIISPFYELSGLLKDNQSAVHGQLVTTLPMASRDQVPPDPFHLHAAGLITDSEFLARQNVSIP